MIPSVYYESVGRNHSAKVSIDCCKWDQGTVVQTTRMEEEAVQFTISAMWCLKALFLEAISDLTDFVRCYEPVFLYMLARKKQRFQKSRIEETEAYGEKRRTAHSGIRSFD